MKTEGGLPYPTEFPIWCLEPEINKRNETIHNFLI